MVKAFCGDTISFILLKYLCVWGGGGGGGGVGEPCNKH